eukprot:TRINITY_DN5078_c0_g4_i1.p1 TRINITY_DN5078_c0_g4~~TRINITY_DN5078_c0_g4_i1.p1  ORF type:complete len:319 (+),score=44.11 TRINITY_DN5078_c0_g4_i1:2009-2965(+)
MAQNHTFIGESSSMISTISHKKTDSGVFVVYESGPSPVLLRILAHVYQLPENLVDVTLKEHYLTPGNKGLISQLAFQKKKFNVCVHILPLDDQLNIRNPLPNEKFHIIWSPDCPESENLTPEAPVRSDPTESFNYTATSTRVINQHDIGMPAGCELCALSEALKILGYDISAEFLWFTDGIVPKEINGDPYGYEGDPTKGGRCWASTVKQTVDNLRTKLGHPLSAVIVRESYLPSLQRYIDEGSSVVFWATFGPDLLGTFPPWNQHNEHAMTLVRCSSTEIQYRDPWVGEERISSSIHRIFSTYNALGSQAVIVKRQH